jgi:hypothetical protein
VEVSPPEEATHAAPHINGDSANQGTFRARNQREWMIRSYSILLISLEGRVLITIPPIGRGQMDSIVLVNWGCFSVTLVVTEIYLRHRETFPSRTGRPEKRNIDSCSERPRFSLIVASDESFTPDEPEHRRISLGRFS